MKAPRPLNPRQLEAFRAVMLTGSMTGAGRFLSISQPAVTRLIRELEEELKLDLFVRDGAHIMPSEEARALSKEVERHYAGTERIREAAYAIREFKGSRIRVAANLSITLACMPQVISRFEAEYPDSVITVRSGVSSEIIDLVSSGSADIGFAAVRPGREDIGTTTLVASEWLCMLPKGHPLEGHGEITAADLNGMDFISVGPSAMSRYELDQVLQAAGASPRFKLETEYSVSAATFVRAGLGIALVDPLTAYLFGREGVVSKRFLPSIPYVLSVVFPHAAKPEGLASRFAELVKAEYETAIKDPP